MTVDLTNVRWSGHVARVESMRKLYKILVKLKIKNNVTLSANLNVFH
jgi:hypothetical protein